GDSIGLGYLGLNRLSLNDTLDRRLMHLCSSRLSLDRILTLDRTDTTNSVGGFGGLLVGDSIGLGYLGLNRLSLNDTLDRRLMHLCSSRL
ncbi:hypothetical protein H7I41_16440, partial [Mycobacterium manitobense]